VPDFFDVLCRTAQKNVASGFYSTFAQYDDETPNAASRRRVSERINTCVDLPLIAEIKVASPTMGALRVNANAGEIATRMEAGGAAGISVVTEPRFFRGSARLLENVRSCVSVPLLMKDFVVSTYQIEAARAAGASAILLIQALFDRGYATHDVEEMIELAHAIGLEVLLEAHTEAEFERALLTDADLVGINNRDLRTLDVDLTTTKKILESVSADGRIVISESGVMTQEDALFLRRCGADALLVGSALMRSKDVLLAVDRLVNAR
jgi:indole-3-glycerol phosphate synthase